MAGLSAVRDAWRALRRNAAMAVPVALVLALAIGANGLAWSLVDSVLLRRLPYSRPDRLAMVWSSTAEAPTDVVSWPDFLDWQRQSRSFESMTGFHATEEQLAGGDEPEVVEGAAVSPEFFGVLGIRPAAGRFFLAGDATKSAAEVVVLSERLWKRRFGASRAVLGRVVHLSGVPVQVVGIAPAGFRQPDPLDGKEAELWVPLAGQSWMANRQAHMLRVIGRLRPESGIRAGQAEMSAIGRRLAAQYPASNAGEGVRVVDLHRQLTGDLRPGLLMAAAAIAALLLVACANAGNQLLAYRLRKDREFALRMALGATRGALARQSLLEGLLLTCAAGAAGLLLGAWGSGLMSRFAAATVAGGASLSFGPRAVAFTVLVTAVTGVLISLAPMLKSLVPGRVEALGVHGHTAASPRVRALRGLLLVGEIAATLALLACAALLARSFANLRRVDPGFDARRVVTFRLSLPAAAYPDRPQRRTFYEVLLEDLGRVPGVEAIGAVSSLPLAGVNDREMPLILQGDPTPEGLSVHYEVVSAGYFDALRVPLLRGRAFGRSDGAEAQRVAIVNRSLAARLWPQRDPIGRQLSFDFGKEAGYHWMTVVGVAGDVRQEGLASAPTAVLYRPIAQDPVESFTFAVRSGREGQGLVGLVSAMKAAVRRRDAGLALADVQPMVRLVEKETARSRFLAVLLEAMAGVTLVVTALGLVGLMSYLTGQRAREVAIRIALGAQRRDLVVTLVRPAVGLVGAGIGCGVAAALAVRPVLAHLVFGIGPADAVTLVGSAAVVAAVGMVTAYLPVRGAVGREGGRVVRGLEE
jgi:putative ABC transport system permease protein